MSVWKWKKKMVSTCQKITSRNKAIFQKLDFHEQKKAPNEKVLFEVDRKLVSTIKNGKFISEYVFLPDEKTAYIGRNIKK